MVAASPYRLFFPLGVLAGIIGVMLFPLFIWGVLPVSPNLIHPRFMIHGFAGAFIYGFLGTAWPRFLEAKRLTAREVFSVAALWFASLAAYAFPDALRLGDALFAGAQTVFAACLLIRLRGAEDTPPPGFSLALFSILLSIPALLFEDHLLAQRFMRYLYWLLPVLGVGSYLIPRFFPEANFKADKRKRRIMLLGVTLLLLASLPVEQNHAQIAFAIRALALLWWGAAWLPIFLTRAPGTRAFVLKCAVATLPAAYALKAIQPGPLFAYSHILFLMGMGLIMLLIGDRVSIAHADSPRSAPPVSRLWRWIFWLTVLTTATRVSADLLPRMMMSHYEYAAILWAFILALWALWHRRHWKW